MQTTRLKIGGMDCAHCAETIEKALENQTGVRSATVHLDSGAAEVQYEEREVAPEQLIALVESTGYSATFDGKNAGGMS